MRLSFNRFTSNDEDCCARANNIEYFEVRPWSSARLKNVDKVPEKFKEVDPKSEPFSVLRCF